eukprot:3922781-Rhodomonas_salina.1
MSIGGRFRKGCLILYKRDSSELRVRNGASAGLGVAGLGVAGSECVLSQRSWQSLWKDIESTAVVLTLSLFTPNDCGFVEADCGIVEVAAVCPVIAVLLLVQASRFLDLTELRVLSAAPQGSRRGTSYMRS